MNQDPPPRKPSPSSTGPRLRLVKAGTEGPQDVLPFERRRCDRKRANGRVTGVVLAAEDEIKQARGRQANGFPKPLAATKAAAASAKKGESEDFRSNKIAGFRLQDLSETGMGLLSQEPVAIGDRITVFMPPHGAEQGEDLVGNVVRCELADDGFAVGVELTRVFTARSA